MTGGISCTLVPTVPPTPTLHTYSINNTVINTVIWHVGGPTHIRSVSMGVTRDAQTYILHVTHQYY